MVSTTDPYDLLGIAPGASRDTMKQAWRRAALQWHPDARPGDAHAQQRFVELREAYGAVMARAGNPRISVPPAPAPVDRARQDLSWLHAGLCNHPPVHVLHQVRQRRRRRRLRVAIRRGFRRAGPALRCSGWVLVLAYLLIGMLGAFSIVETCHRRSRPPRPGEPVQAAAPHQWVVGWPTAGTLVVLLSCTGWRRRRRAAWGLTSAALLLTAFAAAECLRTGAIAAAAWSAAAIAAPAVLAAWIALREVLLPQPARP